MGSNRPDFADLMADAHHAMLALDDVTKRDSAKATAAAVNKGQRIYSQLLDYQRTARMTRAEANTLQTALDMLGARLRSFGEAASKQPRR